VFVGVRADGVDAQAFLDDARGWPDDVQRGGGPAGAIAVATFNYIVYWECWPDEASARGSTIPRLAEIARAAYQQAIPHHPLSQGAWAPYEGVCVAGGESFNFEFRRRKES
jgi:hypothetical protein